MYEVRTIDDAIDNNFRALVWKYIQNQPWTIAWKKYKGTELHELTEYVPALSHSFKKKVPPPPSMFMPRAVFGSDEYTLKTHHPIIFDLWQKINQSLNNEFEIAGIPEGLPAEKREPKWAAPPTKDPNIKQGWRVYANSQPNEYYKRSHGVHRDQPNLDIDNTFTLLYIANPEWYPTWYAENVFYPDDNTTGDFQQFQVGAQQREFGIGWGDNAKFVSPRPGRIILFDSRQLHTTRPSAIWAKEDRKAIVFRLRKVK
jgi:hypothetical protein